MSLARVKSWVVEVLTASDLNAEFNNILNYLNGTSVTLTSPVLTTPSVTGLLDISGATSGQVKFPATQNASSDANTLDDYEEGTWTPTDGSGAALSFSAVSAAYTKIGNMVWAYGTVTYPATGSGASAILASLPFTVANANYAVVPSVLAGNIGGATPCYVETIKNTTTAKIVSGFTDTSGITNATLTTALVHFLIIYPAA